MKAAAIQMCSTNNVQENLRTAEPLIAHAAKQGAKLIVLPEMFAIMGAEASDKVLVSETFGQGIIQNFLSHQAKLHKAWIVSGTIPLVCDDKTKIRAACLVYDDQGHVAARYDKIHLFDVVLPNNESYEESDSTESGNELVVVETPVGKLGLTVCYDLRFPELFRNLANMGAEIIAVPSAFTEKTGSAHWDLLTRCRAVENFCYIIGACQGGTHANRRKTYGHSMIVGPWGDVLAKLDSNTPGAICGFIDLDQLKEIRQSFPVLDHQKIFFDLSELK